MDLGSYANIVELGKVARENGISVPRERGYRYMKVETPFAKETIERRANEQAMNSCESALREVGRSCYEYSARTDKKIKKYMVKKIVEYDNGLTAVMPVAVNWNAVHGKLRKKLKFVIKNATKNYKKQFETFNKYCGRDDVLYIHARIGGRNWFNYDGAELERQPWFIEKVDDSFDDTYCDIYARINPETARAEA